MPTPGPTAVAMSADAAVEQPAPAAVPGEPEPDAAVAPGPVTLVGAGPGDPELLTIRALRRLEAAEVVLHDNLIGEEVLAMVPKTALLINVGKRCGDSQVSGLRQQEIHDLLLLHSSRGRRVVRLKCGDPFIFGRGGEEVEFLAQHGVRAEVVPGVTAALGASASCQMPLTHRAMSSQVRFITGQSKAGELLKVDWPSLAREAPTQTTVFYMGLQLIDEICTQLREHGAPHDLPMAFIESATLPGERRVFGSLGTMPQLAREHKEQLTGPVLLLLGPTAAFPARLAELHAAARGADEGLPRPPAAPTET